jgi:hypothetical protein
VRALDLTSLSEEIARQKKFFVNLAHCLQVLASLEEQFSPQVREHYKEQHTALHARSQTILERCSGHINGLEEAYAEWAQN